MLVGFEADFVSYSGYETLRGGTIEPVPRRGLVEGLRAVKDANEKARQIADVSGTPSIQSAVVTTKAFAARDPVATASFVRAWTEAIAVIHRDKPFTLKVIERYTRSDDPETVEETYRTMAPHFKRTPLPPVEVIQTYLRELGQQGERAKGLRVDDLVDARFVRQLEQSGFIAELYR